MDHDPPPLSFGLQSLRLKLATILRGLEHPPLGAGVALAEECGEVSKLLLDHHGYGLPLDPQKLGVELADVLVCVCEIATLHQVDLDAAVRTKLADLESKAPVWRRTIGEALKRARGD